MSLMSLQKKEADMPRKPHRHSNPERAIHNREAKPARTRKRLEARMAYLRQLRKEREIGVDPKFDHSRGRSETEWIAKREHWNHLSAIYDKAMAS